MSTPPSALADHFATDARDAVLAVLREAGGALTAAQLKQALVAGGVERSEVDARWGGLQRGLRSDTHVVVEQNTYRWVAERALSAEEALDLIVTSRPDPVRRAELIDVVRKGLTGRGGIEIDALRPLAALASEVEELTANEVEPEVLIRRVRASVRRSGLEAIQRAGEATLFDPKRHKPIGPPIAPGAAVTVVRPGYSWGDVVLDRAVVEE